MHNHKTYIKIIKENSGKYVLSRHGEWVEEKQIHLAGVPQQFPTKNIPGPVGVFYH